ncbi:MAG: type II toxin-antitoxin system VapC family toxin [Candidatus Acidiferrum sp.]
MKLLLDTHIWLWLLDNSRKLNRQVLRRLQDQQNELWLSPISTWEVLTLHHKGRIQLQGDLSEWVVKAITGTNEAPITQEIAFAARQLPLHQDPADRLIAATAMVLNLTLVTADERLWVLGNIKTLANRRLRPARHRIPPALLC